MFTLHYFTFHTPFTPKVTSGASTKLCMSGTVCISDKGKGDAHYMWLIQGQKAVEACHTIAINLRNNVVKSIKTFLLKLFQFWHDPTANNVSFHYGSPVTQVTLEDDWVTGDPS